ncbi:PucR family transcriptional regulator [Blastococcus mobilis]|uniref:PucR family transcriptional regulator n=1 Tax=Blastococcus mobilis TaxID=1938746 RepID=UPI001594E927|nr:PucR family transcriptional regulator [Blastococcus mobilis]
MLAHPSLTPGEPFVLAGSSGLRRRVRWIHSSEVIEIASLLRGGELLLTGGEMLAGASAADQRRYVRQLAERNVAGVAIEIGSGLSAVPEAVLTEADAVGFPVIELRRRIPFVDVAEAVNAELVNQSVILLRYGGELAHALSGILAHGGDVRALLELLVQRTGVPAALFTSAGRLITRFPDPEDALPAESPSPPVGGTTSRISVRGAHAATLILYPRPDTDPELLAVIGERASEAIGLALLRSHPPSTRDFAASELARTACRAPQNPTRLIHLGQLIGFDPADPVVAIALITAATSAGLPGFDGLLRRHGRIAMDTSETEVRAVLSLPDRKTAATGRAALVAQVKEWARDLNAVVVGVGPVVPDLASVSTSMELAVSAVQQRSAYGPGSVVDATATAIESLLGGEDLRLRREQFVRGQLAMLLALRPAERETLLHTLEVYLDSGCSKTRTADALHVQRQSLYGRLDRVFRMVGGDPTGTDRVLPLHLALRLRHGLQQSRLEQPT